MMKRLLLTTCLILMSAIPLQAEERIELQGTAIIGNQELPKVLYIVPWKSSELPQLNEPPLESLVDEALSPIDREVFRRQSMYYDALAEQEAPVK